MMIYSCKKDFPIKYAITILFSLLISYQANAHSQFKSNDPIKRRSIKALRKVIASVEKRPLHLCKRLNSGELVDEITVERPTSDHDILVHLTKYGYVATWNILNPDSPVSPGFLPSDRQGLYELCSEEDKDQHLQDVADAIGQLFAAGVDAIALQEVPVKGSAHFFSFVRHLKALSQKSLKLQNGFILDELRPLNHRIVQK